MKWAVACDCSDAPEDQPYAERYVNAHGLSQAAATAAWNTRAPHPDREAEPTGGVVGAAEREVGRAVYERIEALMEGGANPELAYLAELAESVEEYGSYSGPTVPLALGHPVAWKFNVLNTIAGTDEDRLSFETPTCKTGERIRSVQALSVSPPVVEGSSLRDTQPGADAAVVEPGGWLIKDFADGWIWTDRRIAAVAALTDGHSVFDMTRQEYARHQPTTPGEQGEEGA